VGIIAQTPAAFKRALPAILAKCKGDMSSTFQALLIELLEQMRILEERIARINQWIAAFVKNSVLCQKIQVIGGVGPITATATVAAVGEAKEFKNGCHLSAWLGLVPRQYFSGGVSQDCRASANAVTLACEHY